MFPGLGFSYNDGQMKLALHVQIIRTVWTKLSRGAPAATARARVPLWLPVEPNLLKENHLSTEIFLFSESDFTRPDSYQRQHTELAAGTAFDWSGFFLNWNGHKATTRWEPSTWTTGIPRPGYFNRQLGCYEVPCDSWVRLRWHGRFREYDSGQWWYEQNVVNVARCDEELSVDFSGKPARNFEWLPQLR